MPKKPNQPYELALWFWKTILKKPVSVITSREPTFRMLLSQASRLTKVKEIDGIPVPGLDAEVIRKTLQQMEADGRHPKNLYAVEWENHRTGLSWYETVKEEAVTECPPIYEQLALKDWLLQNQPDSPLLETL